MPETFRVVVTDFINDELEPERRVLGDVATVECSMRSKSKTSSDAWKTPTRL